MKEEVTCEFRDIDNNDFNMYTFLNDWQTRIENSDKKPEDFKFKIDVSEIRENWHNYPIGVVSLPVTFDDNEEVHFNLEVTKKDEECPFKEDIAEFTLDVLNETFLVN